ncbi:MAG TPA: prolyl oligopeptidase family serine peptidase [Candidatus Methylacidiphilales bacterium]|jgi:prolyl oligopeptidase|nr:prolyl oligopeptidase family serine peptidase [Candidatus Methylacidiphilales bacterium]
MVSTTFPRSSRVVLAAVLLVVPFVVRADAPLSQPVAPVKPVTDTYFGTKVVDNYRWMEDLKSPELQKWWHAQAAYTKDYLAKLPGRDALEKRIEELDNAATRVGGVELCGSRYFYMKLTPADQTPKLYARDGLTGAERLLVDPQVLGEATAKLIGTKRAAPSERGQATRYTLSDFYVSDDGKFVAVEVAAGGSEEGVVRILDAATGATLPDWIDRVWGASVSWDSSDKFFYYTRLQKLGPGMTPNDKELDEAAYLHHVGANADKDVPVFGRKFTPNIKMIPTDSAYVGVVPGSPYALGVIAHGVRNEATMAISPADALAAGKPVWTKIIDVDDDVTDCAIMGHDIWLLSHKDASKFKVLHMSLDHPDISKADVTIPPSDLVIKGLATAKDGLYVQATQGGISHVLRVPYGETGAKELPLPFAGSVEGFSCSLLNDGAYLRLAGWTEAPQWYAFDPTANTLTNTNLEPLNPTDFSGITSVEVTAPAADGTPIPLSIIYKKDLKLDGSNPCLMEGYGSYGISIDPNFDATRLALLEKGIVIAWAHVRGGGENGEDWHNAGKMATKENTISDFIACAQYLIKNGYTSPGKLALRGTSAGGITIGGALTQRPDLFALAIINVGEVDALRSEAGPNGAVNTPEFGSVHDEAGFKSLYAMDAYQHVKDGTPYPTVLLITGANDPRVDPWQLFKMTARLQAATSSKNPILLRVDTDAGHGIGSTKTQRDMITADQAALLLEIASKSPPST